MNLSKATSDRIVEISHGYIGKEFDFETFNCVHFVREVYARAGIVLPLLIKRMHPPREFHLMESEFLHMPVGHSVFFKRKESRLNRAWTHLAIIVSADTLIHCTRNISNGVVLTPKSVFMDTYVLSPVPELALCSA